MTGSRRRAGGPAGTPSARPAAKQTSADRAYQHLREMVMTYRLLPGQRMNERALAAQIKASRTPLREALNRLVSEGVVVLMPDEGFACRPLDPQDIFDLYEMRAGLESQGVQLAAERASEADILSVEQYLEKATPADKHLELVQRDVDFHERIADLSGNREIARLLRTINTRIYFIRWIDRINRQEETDNAHALIYAALRDRDGAAASSLMYAHISRRMDHIIDVVRRCFAHLYTREPLSRLGGAVEEPLIRLPGG